jgi:hypothetical protein
MNIELPGAVLPSNWVLATMPAIERLQPGITEKGEGWVVLVAREHRDAAFITQEERYHEMLGWARENNIEIDLRMIAQVGDTFWKAEVATYGAASLFYLRWS